MPCEEEAVLGKFSVELKFTVELFARLFITELFKGSGDLLFVISHWLYSSLWKAFCFLLRSSLALLQPDFCD